MAILAAEVRFWVVGAEIGANVPGRNAVRASFTETGLRRRENLSREAHLQELIPMLRFSTFALLCLAATPAFAQNQTAPAPAAPAGPPPEAMAAVQQAGMAFGTCVQTAAGSVPATVTPEAGAASALASCATQRQTLEQAAHALIATLPEAQRAMAEEQMRSQLAALPGQIAVGIAGARGAATPPAATPAR
jgi:hypothetical protein